MRGIVYTHSQYRPIQHPETSFFDTLNRDLIPEYGRVLVRYDVPNCVLVLDNVNNPPHRCNDKGFADGSSSVIFYILESRWRMVFCIEVEGGGVWTPKCLCLMQWMLIVMTSHQHFAKGGCCMQDFFPPIAPQGKIPGVIPMKICGLTNRSDKTLSKEEYLL